MARTVQTKRKSTGGKAPHRYKSPRQRLAEKAAEVCDNKPHNEDAISAEDYKMVTPADLKTHETVTIRHCAGRFNIFQTHKDWWRGYQYTNDGRVAINDDLAYYINMTATEYRAQTKKNGVVCKRITKFMDKVFAKIDTTQSFTRLSLYTHIQTITRQIIKAHVDVEATLLEFGHRAACLSHYVDPDSLKTALP